MITFANQLNLTQKIELTIKPDLSAPNLNQTNDELKINSKNGPVIFLPKT